MEGLTDEKEDLTFEIEPNLFSIGTITLSVENISWLNVGVLEIRSTKESDAKQKTLDVATLLWPSVGVKPNTWKK